MDIYRAPNAHFLYLVIIYEFLELCQKWADVSCRQLGPRHCLNNTGVGVIPFSICTSRACAMTGRNLTIFLSCRWPISEAHMRQKLSEPFSCYSHHVHKDFMYKYNLGDHIIHAFDENFILCYLWQFFFWLSCLCISSPILDVIHLVPLVT